MKRLCEHNYHHWIWDDKSLVCKHCGKRKGIKMQFLKDWFTYACLTVIVCFLGIVFLAIG